MTTSSEPVSVWQGEFRLFGVTLHVHQLDDGTTSRPMAMNKVAATAATVRSHSQPTTSPRTRRRPQAAITAINAIMPRPMVCKALSANTAPNMPSAFCGGSGVAVFEGGRRVPLPRGHSHFSG